MTVIEVEKVTLNLYGVPIRSLTLIPVGVIRAEIGSRITFEVVGIERVVTEGET